MKINNDWADGPVGYEKRRCTDIIWILVYFLFIIAMIAVSVYGFIEGAPEKYLKPIDTDGNICGKTSGKKEYKYLFFPDLTRTQTVYTNYRCVKSCPKNRVVTECTDDDYNNCNPTGSVKYKKKKYGKFCVPIKKDLPAEYEAQYDDVWDAMNVSTLQMYIYDLEESYPYLIGLFFFAVIFSMILFSLVADCTK